ncbi:hypothetical protein RCS94_03035 [Orbaceae bacterium ac157xtp]
MKSKCAQIMNCLKIISKKTFLLIFLTLTLTSFFANAVLTATTSKVTQGNAPVFIKESGIKKLGFIVQGVEYSQWLGNIDPAIPMKFDASLSLNDFKIKSFAASNFSVANDYLDDDGDEADPNMPFTTGTVSYEWRDANNVIITDMTKKLGCGSNLSMPLKLTIKVPDVQAHSRFGLPKDSALVQLQKEYQISLINGICFAKPASLEWDNLGGSTSRHPEFGGGYSDDFDPVNGFKASATPAFPTTGFAGAKFQLVMSGSQKDYSFSFVSNPNTAASIDANGNITLNKKPSGTGEIVVRATLKSNKSVYYDYKFNPTHPWVVPMENKKNGYGFYTYQDLVKVCGSESNLLTRAELTNSPQNVATATSLKSKNAYTRAIGEGVFSEWGRTGYDGWADDANDYPNYYPSSNWVGYWYWTQDVHSPSYRFIVGSAFGRVTYQKESQTGEYGVCRG